jgi:diacylglycerol O-acyltransferase / wax synthase
MRQLSATDALFLSLERPQTPFHIGMLQIYSPMEGSGSPGFGDILDELQRRLHISRSFREKVVSARFGLDFPYWVDDPDFDLEYHVRHIALPRPGNWRQLCAQAAWLHARILDRSRPLWEMTLIEGLDSIEGTPSGSFAIYFKIHHAAIDGVAGAELLTAIHMTARDAAIPAPTGQWRPENLPSRRVLLTRAAVNNVRRPIGAVRSAVPILPSPRSVAKAVFRMPALPTARAPVPTTRFNRPVTAHRAMDARTFALDDLKQIKDAIPGATVNDVALAVVGGALRAYLDAHQELPEHSLIAAVPVSTRLAIDDPDGNRISVMMAPVGTHIADPVERVKSIANETRRKKERMNAVRARAVAEMAQVIPGAVVGVAMRRLAPLISTRRPVANVIVTNVPGPPEPLFAFGARMIECYGLGPIADGLGLIHLVGSYAGAFMVSFTACREMLPDPGFYADQIQESMDQLRAVVEVADNL